MIKVYKKLTKDQKDRGVVFSSTLSKYRTETTADTIHEVFNDTEDKDAVMSRLLDDKFFNGSPWKYNIVRR